MSRSDFWPPRGGSEAGPQRNSDGAVLRCLENVGLILLIVADHSTTVVVDPAAAETHLTTSRRQRPAADRAALDLSVRSEIGLFPCSETCRRFARPQNLRGRTTSSKLTPQSAPGKSPSRDGEHSSCWVQSVARRFVPPGDRDTNRPPALVPGCRITPTASAESRRGVCCFAQTALPLLIQNSSPPNRWGADGTASRVVRISHKGVRSGCRPD
jgi:hypothetical protein